MLLQQTRIKRLSLVVLGILSLLALPVFISTTSSAAPVIGFNPGRIIDDAVFTNKNSMSVTEIQTFINAKGVNCVNGEAPCLKNYSEGGRSAARIIYDTAQQYNINPQTLIVVLQKEVGLLTVSQPGAWRYRTAMGYGCPDTAACDSQYYGFSNQMRWAATMYRAIMNDSPTWYTPYNLGNNTIKWNPQASCGSSVVNIENRATKALYNYTPYRPNQAALNAGYGTGDSCSSYGNRNFFLYFRDWFGATTDNRLFYRVIRGDQSGEVYLQTSAGKYYVPSYALLAEWDLYPQDLEVLSQSYVNGLPNKTTLSNTLTDGTGNLFIVEGGNTHQVTSPAVTSVWNADTGSMVESLGLSYILNRKEPLGRFVSQTGGDGSVWLVDGQKKHKVDTSLLYAWGYYPGILNTVSSNLFSRYSVSDPVTQYATPDNGPTTWMIEASTKRPFKDVATKNAYLGASTATNIGQAALSMLSGGQVITRFAYDTSLGSWYLIDSGKKYYINKGELATLWGKSQSEPLTPLSTDALSKIASNGNLSYTARSTSSSAYWLVAKKRYYIGSSDLNVAISGSAAAPTVYSDELINSLPQGGDASDSIQGSSSPYNYTYILDRGVRRYPQSPEAKSGWVSNPVTLPNELLMVLPEGSFIGSVVKNSADSAYYIDANKKYPITQQSSSSWGISTNTPIVDETTLNRKITGQAIADTFSVADTSYVMTNGSRIKISKHKDAYPTLSGPALTSPGDMKNGGEASYLIQSSDTSDTRVWLINMGSKMLLPSFEQRVALGYISNSIQITPVSPQVIASIPTSQNSYSNVIQTGTSGLKFLNFGYSLGFPDSPTLLAYIDTSKGVLSVSPSIYNSFTVRGNVSRLIYDDNGRYFWVENGRKRYINSWSAYTNAGYPNLTPVYLQGITMNLLENGTVIR